MKKIIVDSSECDEHNLDDSRRDFLRNSVLATAGLGLASTDAFAKTHHKRGVKKSLILRSTHLNKTFKADYFNGHRYNITGLFQIDKALMDYRAWQIARIDLKLVELLHEINHYARRRHGAERIDVLSGYRSPMTNRYLRRHSRGVAKHSYHMKAQAVDIHVPGLRLRTLRHIAKGIGMGGVGYYPRSGFVHVDVGPVRSWRRG